MTNVFLLAEATAGGTNSLVVLYYVVGIAALLIAGLWALKKYNDNQRKEWIEQGDKERNLADRLEANTRAAAANTMSIDKLSEKLDRFSDSVQQQLNGHDKRMSRLEDWVSFRSKRSQEHE